MMRRSTAGFVACAVALFAAVACGTGPPARLVAGIADTVVVNGLRPAQLPLQVLDASGHVLPDTGVRYQWTSGLPIAVSTRGVVTCAHAGDAAVRASLGTLAASILVRCRPVHEIRVVGGVLNLVVGDPPQDLVFEAVDSAGRRVTEVAARIRYDSTVFARASTVDGIRPGQHLAVPVRLAAGEMRSWQLPASPPGYEFNLLPDHGTPPTARLAIEGSNCERSSDPLSRWCFALPGASVVVYYPRQTGAARPWSGSLTVFLEPCPRRPRTGVCASGESPP